MRRRLDVALGIIGDPELLFLDEPTTGFDPQARRAFWELVASLRDAGTTILLTTHYLDEAEHLADRVGVINHGRLVAVDTVDALGAEQRRTAVVSWRDDAGRHERATPDPARLVVELSQPLRRSGRRARGAASRPRGRLPVDDRGAVGMSDATTRERRRTARDAAARAWPGSAAPACRSS